MALAISLVNGCKALANKRFGNNKHLCCVHINMIFGISCMLVVLDWSVWIGLYWHWIGRYGLYSIVLDWSVWTATCSGVIGGNFRLGLGGLL